MTVQTKPILYVWMDSDTGGVSISAYKPDDPEYENNHIILNEFRAGKVNKHESLTGIIRNVISLAGIYVDLEIY